MRGLRLYLTFGLSVLWCAAVQAQKYDITVFSIDRGLPSFFVKSVLQDATGTVWMGTDNGIVRYDGYNLINQGLKLRSPYVKQLRPARDGTVWVVNDGGLEKLSPATGDPNRFVLETRLSSFPEPTDSTLHFPRDVYEAPDGVLWISEPIAIVRVEGKRLERFPLPREYHSVGYHLASHVVERTDGTVFVLTEPGYVLQFDSAKRKLTPLRLPLPHAAFNIQTLLRTSGRVLAGGETGVYEFDLTALRWITLASTPGIMGLTEHDGRLFAGTRHDGLLEITRDGPGRIPGTETSGLKCLFKDREHNLWVASDQGAMMLSPGLFGSVFFDDGFPYTQALQRGPDGSLLAANEKAVYWIRSRPGDAGRWELEEKFRVKEHTSILSVSGTPGDFYAGLTDGRLMHCRNGTCEPIRLPAGEKDAALKVFYLHRDPRGDLWVLRDQEQSILRISPGGSISTFGPEQGLTGKPLVVKTAPDRSIWIGGTGDSTHLFRFDETTGRFENRSAGASLPPGREVCSVHDLTFLTGGTVVAAGTRGVVIFDSTGVRPLPNFTIDDPHYLRSITAGRNGSLWIGAENGLFHWVEGQQFSFTVNDGLPGTTCLYRRVLVDTAGTVWVGTNTGIGHLTSDFSYSRPTRTPVLEYVRALAGKQEATQVLYAGDPFTVSVNALMMPGSRVRYRYRLAGTGADWSASSAVRQFSFTGLAAGSYTLEVTARKIGLAESAVLRVPLVVRNHWYKTPVAFGFYAVAAAGLAGFVLLFVYNRRETREIAQRLRGTERRLAAVIDHSPIFLFVIDRSLRFTRVAGHALPAFSHGPESLEGRKAAEVFGSTAASEALAAALEGREGSFIFQHGGRIFDIRITPMPEGNGAVGVGNDITDRIRMEEELIRARDMAEGANRAKSVFLASMSHELRTPLNAILGFSQILNNEQDIPPRFRSYVSIMYKSGEHLLHMINDILDLSKIEAGHMQLNRKDFRFLEFIDDITRMFLVRAGEKNLKLTLHKGPDLPAVVRMDENKVRQILINLIGNAVKFTHEGEVRLSVEREGHLLRIVVADTGEGIAESEQEAIFEPFVQGSRAFKEGTGLGLAITRRLVELMEGRIRLSSAPGTGSEFTVELPFEFGDTAGAESAKEAGRITGLMAPADPVVLIADDIVGNRALISAFFAQVNVSCIEAVNGREAVEMARRHRPDLIVMDIVMPLLSGREALQEIRRDPMLADTPVIAITASGFDSARAELLESGFNEYIRKPFQQHELVQAIEKITGWRFIMEDREAAVPDANAAFEAVRAALTQLPSAVRDEIMQVLEMTDLEGAGTIIPKLPAQSPVRLIFERAVAEANFRLLISLDEYLNGAQA